MLLFRLKNVGIQHSALYKAFSHQSLNTRLIEDDIRALLSDNKVEERDTKIYLTDEGLNDAKYLIESGKFEKENDLVLSIISRDFNYHNLPLDGTEPCVVPIPLQRRVMEALQDLDREGLTVTPLAKLYIGAKRSQADSENPERYATSAHCLRDLIGFCMDELPKQLIRETRTPSHVSPGRLRKYDYIRCGVCSIFLANEPLVGKRYVTVSERRTKKTGQHLELSKQNPDAEVIMLVMDNLNTHKPGSLYELFSPAKAKAIWDRFEFVYTPKHGSWLNMAEIELNVLNGQCLNKRIDNIGTISKECKMWQKARNNMNAKINW